MLFPFFIICIFSSQICKGDEGITRKCTIFSEPKNGHFVNKELDFSNLTPGDKLINYTLEVMCDPGYYNTHSNMLYTCYEDGTVSGDITECLPYCYRGMKDIVSCGSEPRCFDHGVMSRYTSDDDASSCGRLGLDTRNNIVGGRSAARFEVPWHAAIYTKTKIPYMQICGGSLVSRNVVISAAHCFWSEVEKQLPASDFAVAVGKLYRPWNDQHDEQAQKSNVVDVKIPPYFQGSTTNLQDDIALVIVATPFSFTDSVLPVCLDFEVGLDRQQLAAGKLGKVAGWGLTGEDGPPSPVLKVVELPVVDIKQCFNQSDPTFVAYITSDKICAGYQNGTAVCKGDSGGGLAFPDRSPGFYRYVLRGVVSGAPRSDHLCNTLTWASFTHLLRHEHFVIETVSNINIHN